MENGAQQSLPPTQPSAQTPPVDQKSSKWLKILPLILLGLIIVAGLVFYGFQVRKDKGAAKVGGDEKVSELYKKLSGPYVERDNNVYHSFVSGYDMGFVPMQYDLVEGADPLTFKYLGYGFAVDKDSVYCVFTKKLQDVDRSTFEYIPKIDNNERAGVGVDKNYVFHYCNKINGVDIPTFKYLGGEYFADKNTVYVQVNGFHALEDSDPETFTAINNGPYSKDENNVYFWEKIVEGVDAKTFEYINEKRGSDFYYYADKDHIVRNGAVGESR